MQAREFHDGAQDGLEALEPFDPDKIHSFSDLLGAMKKTAFGGRRLGEAFEVLAAMIEDRDCFVVLTLSGAMTIAKMGKIISSMIDHGMVHAIVSTGALIAHGLSESVGKTHYRYDPAITDEELFRKGYNRVYDTLEMESNLNYVEQIMSSTLKRLNADQALSSELLTRELGRTLAEEHHGSGILKSAYLKKVPVYIPAFTDSEMGLDVATWAMGQQIDKARSHYQTCCIDQFCVIRHRFAPADNVNDAPVFNQNIPAGVDVGRRVNHISVCNQQLHGLPVFPLRRFFDVVFSVSTASSRVPPASK